MRLLTLVFLFLFHLHSFGQTTQYQNLLDTALNGQGALFVHSKPISDLQLDENEVWHYSENLKDYSNQILDTGMFLQIIQNAKNADTTLWKDSELPFALLVNSRDEGVSKEYAIQKFSLVDKKQIRFYIKQINQFNSTEVYDRNISYFSRPVFDNTKQFAAVQWENWHSGLAGGGRIILYKLQGNKWEKIGIIMNWRH